MSPEPDSIKTREIIEKLEEEHLASYALKSARAKRLIEMSPEGRVFDYRTEFQRDRDRILYSRAFRRLRNKAGISRVLDEDHGRDRLLHTLEVSQIGRTIGRGLRLNEDLIEAISLGHDLGVPPFGEAAEKVLDAAMRGKKLMESARGGTREIKADPQGFRKNRQSLRVADLLEKRYEHDGLNLTNETREGILKQGEWGKDVVYPGLIREGLQLALAPAFEAQVVFLSGEIATLMEGLDDGLRGRIMDLEDVERLTLVRELIKKIGNRYERLGGRYMKIATLNRGLTHLLVTNAIYHSSQTLARWAGKHEVDRAEKFHERREAIRGNEIAFPPRVRGMFDELGDLVSRKLAHSFPVQRARETGRKTVERLFLAYHANPLILEDYLLLRYRDARDLKFLRDLPQSRIEKEILNYRKDPLFVRMIGDHIAGMTDRYAQREFEKLTLCQQGPVGGKR